ncbi:hypothetical protein VTK26DRAFT_3375 [Humicola hyalothermophila]
MEGPAAGRLFCRQVVEGAKDEVEAHVSLFRREKNLDYERMTSGAAERIVGWFNDETEIYDDPQLAGPAPAEPAETEALAKAVDEEGAAAAAGDVMEIEKKLAEAVEMQLGEDDVPDESPIDIAAAATLAPLAGEEDMSLAGKSEGAEGHEEDGGSDKAEQQKKAYMRHLFDIAQQTGTTLRSYLPAKMPAVEMPRAVHMPAVSMPSMPSISMPTRINPFSSSKKSGPESAASETAPKEGGVVDVAAPAPEAENDAVEGGNRTGVADSRVNFDL